MKIQILVCGGGIAGSIAAISAARNQTDVWLCERGGCLGGTLTASLVGQILDRHNAGGEIVREFYRRLDRIRASDASTVQEAEKYVLESMCREAGVHVLYYTDIYALETSQRRIVRLFAHGLDEELSFSPDVVIDATGSGSIAAMAGCSYDIGNHDGKTQPMSIVGLVSGIDISTNPYVGWKNREAFKKLVSEIGLSTSLGFPNIDYVGGNLCFLSVNHEYGCCFRDTEKLSEAVIHGRQEVFAAVQCLRKNGGGHFRNIALVNTPELIGIREGRRIHGLYTVSLDDVLSGRHHEDAVCRVKYWIDIHALNADGNRSYSGDEISCQPFDIPFRAQLPIDADNLILAGRCISGDFYAHASYRVAGNMIDTGEAAGIMAAGSIHENCPVKQLPPYRAAEFSFSVSGGETAVLF